MGVTPEGKIKKAVNEVLDDPRIYVFRPVQGGYGAAGLDYHCVVRARNTPVAFFVETKKAGKEPTTRQETLIAKLAFSVNARTFVIDDLAGVEELKTWLQRLMALR
jgi:hypothetical protein